jgi:Leucine-rich repeat (LRR) protein
MYHQCQSVLKLESLTLTDDFITDIEGLDRLINLKCLNVAYNRIRGSIIILDRFTQLRLLNLCGNRITSFGNVRWDTLMELDVSYNCINDLEDYPQECINHEKVLSHPQNEPDRCRRVAVAY